MTDRHTRIAVRSYFMAEAAGWPEGQHEAHWLAAEAVERATDLGEDYDAHHGAFLYARLGDMSEVDAVNGVPERGRDMGRQHDAHAEAATKADKRRAAALKGAATRKANREAAAAVVAANALKTAGRPIRRAAH